MTETAVETKQTNALKVATPEAEVAHESLEGGTQYEPGVVIKLLESCLDGHPAWQTDDVWPGSSDEAKYEGAGVPDAVVETLIGRIVEFAKLKISEITCLYLNRDNWMSDGVFVRAKVSKHTAAVAFLTGQRFVISINYQLWVKMTGLQRVHTIYRALTELTQGKPDYSVYWHELERFGSGVYLEQKPLAEALIAGQKQAESYQHELALAIVGTEEVSEEPGEDLEF